ncbi:hypothetical protein QBC37DRAFT_400220 [Rhypophila decipiens]|uniref:Uncharacterized protein n=1 Tax=Rhypophila decipiens TaxID=261697 RepID=A0AAN6Y816_9PEZI|nr:hypothetical protein QBC37DRAFT_400220 [Rhypophila decipiens]
MPEPFSIAIASFGTTVGVLSLLASTLSNLNIIKRKFLDFSRQIAIFANTLDACRCDLDELDTLWGYDVWSDNVFQEVFGDQFERVQGERERVIKHANKVREYLMDKFLKMTEEEAIPWLQDPRKTPGVFLWKLRIRYAFFSEETLRTKITDLEKAISNLRNTHRAQQKRLLGDNPKPTLNPKHINQLVTLRKHGEWLWGLRQKGETSRYYDWTIDLRPPGWEGSTDIIDWENVTLDRAQIWLSFRTPQGYGYSAQEYRLRFDQDVNAKLCLLGPLGPGSVPYLLVHHPEPRRNVGGNPIISTERLLYQRTKDFQRLFAEEEFFRHPSTYTAWQSDLGQLLVSLTNWSALLWNTNWITDLCPSGIRFVDEGGPPEPRLHTLGQRPDHADGDYGDCNHSTPEFRLRNLGLVMAGLICASAFRFTTRSQRRDSDIKPYQLWKPSERRWVSLRPNDILIMVKDKSKSVTVKDAVHFCFEYKDIRGPRSDSRDVYSWDNHATFLRNFIEKVIVPWAA